MARRSIVSPTQNTKAADAGFSLLDILKKSTQSGGTGGGSANGGGAASGGTGTSAAQNVQGLAKELYDTTFRPATVTVEKLEPETLQNQISAWLRPSYDLAIQNRQQQTVTYRGDLDADAISRGMGASTYVTDVKSRLLTDEAKDISLMETEYGATLAKNLSEAISNQQDRIFKAEQFNAEAEQQAYEQAYQAALTLYQTYGTVPSGTSVRYTQQTGAEDTAATTPKNCQTFLSTLDPQQRGEIYQGKTAEAATFRREILASVGPEGYANLMEQYPA